jgi:hemerythrin-like domain-containing protein
MLESGEHSTSKENPHTPVDLMEDDHIKLIQLATLSFNLLGLAMRLKDQADIAVTFDLAYNNGKELVELLKLHIYREDNTLFPLAQKLLTKQELAEIYD